MEVIISEQNALLEDINNFINDLKELKKESWYLSDLIICRHRIQIQSACQIGYWNDKGW
jgi:hypothetical protein